MDGKKISPLKCLEKLYEQQASDVTVRVQGDQYIQMFWKQKQFFCHTKNVNHLFLMFNKSFSITLHMGLSRMQGYGIWICRTLKIDEWHFLFHKKIVFVFKTSRNTDHLEPLCLMPDEQHTDYR